MDKVNKQELRRLAELCIKGGEFNAALGNIRAFNAAANPAAILSLLDELERAESDGERLRMQLVACGVVALCNTPESATKARDMHPDYMSASCQDVMRVVDAEMAMRAELEQCRKDAESLRGSCKALGEQNKHLTRRVKALSRAVSWFSDTGWGVARPKWLLAILTKEGGANG